jgi:CTP synthase
MVKYVLVTGGVLSGLGKGVISSSTGVILRSLGFRVTAIKIDPYINIDAGTMSPFEHGEVFVLDDGGEADLDLGNYERFMDLTLNRDNNITTGKIYHHVIEKERKGGYLGKTVQVVPHITDAIQEWVERVASVGVDGNPAPPDICIIELGGTIGDIEHGPFIEAMRQFQWRVGKENFCNIHVSLVPVVGAVGEQKTKPTQASVRELRALGLSPDMIVCRSSIPVAPEVCTKVASFCHVAPNSVISVHDVSNLYRVPLLLMSQGLPGIILSKFGLNSPRKVARMTSWERVAQEVDALREDENAKAVHIAVVGKYTHLSDAYLSVIRALQHAAQFVHRKLQIDWIESLFLEDAAKQEHPKEHEEAWTKVKSAHGLLVPGGFGDRGVEGKVLAAHYARTNKVPYLGVCLGMQVAVIEFARNVVGLQDANSTEFNEEATHPVVIFMPEGSKTHMGATMRLGSRRTDFVEGKSSVVRRLYGGGDGVDERHRHRYEVNPEYIERLEEKGLSFVGFGDNKLRAEIVELPYAPAGTEEASSASHPYYVGVQYHPEFKTRHTRPSPPFLGLILAASGQLETWLDSHGGQLGNKDSSDEENGFSL